MNPKLYTAKMSNFLVTKHKKIQVPMAVALQQPTQPIKILQQILFP